MKKIISAVLIIAMAASMAACGDSSKADESGDLIYGEVQSISGNDVVIHIAKYNGDKDDSDDASESDDTGSSSDRKRSRGDFKPGSFDGSMPEGFDPKNFDGSMPEGMSRPDGAGRKSKSSKSSGKFTVTDEEQELRIPVGTNVTTSSGVKTSFDKIAKDDIIKFSVEKGDDGKYTVKEVWIMDK